MYTLEKAALITEQLRKFKDGYAHHAAGQYSNLDFWINEVSDAAKVIDDYRLRFDRLSVGQKNWVVMHNTLVGTFCGICGGRCEFDTGNKPPAPPMRYSSEPLNEARRELIDAAYFFLIKLYRQNLIDKTILKTYCNKLETSIDLEDLK